MPKPPFWKKFFGKKQPPKPAGKPAERQPAQPPAAVPPPRPPAPVMKPIKVPEERVRPGAIHPTYERTHEAAKKKEPEKPAVEKKAVWLGEPAAEKPALSKAHRAELADLAVKLEEQGRHDEAIAAYLNGGYLAAAADIAAKHGSLQFTSLVVREMIKLAREQPLPETRGEIKSKLLQIAERLEKENKRPDIAAKLRSEAKKM